MISELLQDLGKKVRKSLKPWLNQCDDLGHMNLTKLQFLLWSHLSTKLDLDQSISISMQIALLKVENLAYPASMRPIKVSYRGWGGQSVSQQFFFALREVPPDIHEHKQSKGLPNAHLVMFCFILRSLYLTRMTFKVYNPTGIVSHTQTIYHRLTHISRLILSMLMHQLHNR